jgi:hypothetical protein
MLAEYIFSREGGVLHPDSETLKHVPSNAFRSVHGGLRSRVEISVCLPARLSDLTRFEAVIVRVVRCDGLCLRGLISGTGLERD